jgi:hypothetical protein
MPTESERPFTLAECQKLAEEAFAPAIEQSRQTPQEVHERLREGWARCFRAVHDEGGREDPEPCAPV